MNCRKGVVLSIILALLLGTEVWAQSDLESSFSDIKKALSGIQISAGPDSSRLTRSPWGPDLYNNTVDAVVLIWVPSEVEGDYSEGSGVVVTAAGHIITNWHVIQNNRKVIVVFRPSPPNILEDVSKGDLWVANVLGTLQEKDLGFLELDHSLSGSRDLSFLRFIPLEDPDRIEIGQDVFTIGHPEGLYWTYTEGVISQIRPRYNWVLDGKIFKPTVIQTQTAISYGSSGGPLINRSGKLIGIIWGGLLPQAGFNFAISAHELTFFLGGDSQ